MTETILLTGCAGFIAYHTGQKLLKRGYRVVGVDNLNDYYDVSLKKSRLGELKTNEAFTFYEEDVSDREEMSRIFDLHSFDAICNLAAQAGVRYSIENPFIYEETNIKGTLVLLELAREHDVQNFVGASSSSVYGGKESFPLSEDEEVDQPISVYAATKRSTELLGYTYHHLYDMKCVLLRYFTVYGPYGRPDMALFVFTERILNDRPIDVYNHGDMQRDFTYVEDIAEGTVAALEADLGYEIINLSNNEIRELMDFIHIIEETIGKEAEKNFMEKQPGEVEKTSASIEKAQRLLDYHPTTSLEEGIPEFIQWYRDFYNV